MIDSSRIIRILRDVILRKGVYKSGVIKLSEDPELSYAIEGSICLLADDDSKLSEPWPRNLLLDIGLVVYDDELSFVENNLMQALETISPEYRDIVIKYYKDCLSCSEIAETYGFTTARVRRVLSHSISALKENERILMICSGESAVVTSRNIRKMLIDEINQNMSFIDESQSFELPDKKAASDVLKKDISALFMPEKVYRTLKSAGIDTLGQLQESSLTQLKNLCKGSFYTLIVRANALGVAFIRE